MTEAEALQVLATNAQPATEYCLFRCNLWWLCLTKSEWAAWTQAIGALLALGIAIHIGRAADRDAKRHAKSNLVTFSAVAHGNVERLVEAMRSAVPADIALCRASLEGVALLGRDVRNEHLPLRAVGTSVAMQSIVAQAIAMCSLALDKPGFIHVWKFPEAAADLERKADDHLKELPSLVGRGIRH